MLEFVSQYAVIFVVGVIFIIIGIILTVRNKKLKRIVRATVIDCVKAESIICGSRVECFETTFEIKTTNGVIHNTIKRQEPFDVGASFNVKYYQKEDRIELAKEENNNLGNLPIVLFSIGFFIIIAMTLVGLYKTDVEKFIYIFCGLIGMIFASAGLYECVYRPNKLNKQMKDCVMVQGVVVDYTVNFRYHNGRVYRSIYEYYYEGVYHRIESLAGGSERKYAEIGRRVTIAVNRNTGKAYCLEDEKVGRKIGIIFLIVGAVVIAMVNFMVR